MRKQTPGGYQEQRANSPPLRNLTVPENTGPATPFHTPGELNRQVDVVPLNVNQGGPQGIDPLLLAGVTNMQSRYNPAGGPPRIENGNNTGRNRPAHANNHTHRGTTRDRYPLGRTPIMSEMLTDLRVMKIPRMIPLQRKENLIS